MIYFTFMFLGPMFGTILFGLMFGELTVALIPFGLIVGFFPGLFSAIFYSDVINKSSEGSKYVYQKAAAVAVFTAVTSTAIIWVSALNGPYDVVLFKLSASAGITGFCCSVLCQRRKKSERHYH